MMNFSPRTNLAMNGREAAEEKVYKKALQRTTNAISPPEVKNEIIISSLTPGLCSSTFVRPNRVV